MSNKLELIEIGARAQELGVDGILVSWAPSANNPSVSYHRLGFKETGDFVHGEIIAAIEL